MSRVYVGGLPSHASRRDVERFFRGYGKVREIVMMRNYAFVEFDDCVDADDAIQDLNGRELAGTRVVVEMTRLPPRVYRSRRRTPSPPRRSSPPRGRPGGPKFGPPERTDYRLIIKNLPSRISWQDLKDLMRKVGEVTFADAHVNKKNEGVVEFVNGGDMRDAIYKYDGYELYGRKLQVFEDRERRSESRSPSGSKSGSKSPSHSKRRRRSRSRGSRSRRRSHSRSRKRRSTSRSRSRSRSKKTRSSHKKRHRDDSRSPPKRRNKSKSRSPSKKESRKRSRSPKRRTRHESASSSEKRAPSRSPSESKERKDNDVANNSPDSKANNGTDKESVNDSPARERRRRSSDFHSDRSHSMSDVDD